MGPPPLSTLSYLHWPAGNNLSSTLLHTYNSQPYCWGHGYVGKLFILCKVWKWGGVRANGEVMVLIICKVPLCKFCGWFTMTWNGKREVTSIVIMYMVNLLWKSLYAAGYCGRCHHNYVSYLGCLSGVLPPGVIVQWCILAYYSSQCIVMNNNVSYFSYVWHIQYVFDVLLFVLSIRELKSVVFNEIFELWNSLK